MEVRAAKQEELNEILDLLCVVFLPQSRSRYASHIHGDSSYRLHQSRVCVVDGRIVSHVRVCDRLVRVGGTLLRVGGVGCVATLPGYRHRGYGTATLQNAMQYMVQEGYDLSMIAYIISPALYRRFGWTTFPRSTFKIELHQRRKIQKTFWRARPFEVERDLPQVMEIYDEYNSQRNATFVRTAQYWQDEYSRRISILPSLVVEKDGQIGAYANLSFRSSDSMLRKMASRFFCRAYKQLVRLSANSVANFLEKVGSRAENGIGSDRHLVKLYPDLREVAYRAEHPESLYALYHAIIEKASESGIQSISGSLPANHPMLQLLCQGSASPPLFLTKETIMYRIFSLSDLFKKLIPEFRKRLEQSDVRVKTGSFHFLLTDQLCPSSAQVSSSCYSATLEIRQRTIVVSEGEIGRTKVSLTMRDFIEILFGDIAFSQLKEVSSMNGISFTYDDMALLDALFPKRETMRWVCDYF